MFGTIVIETATKQARFKTNAYYNIYDFLIGCNFSHEEAEGVASWAELASVGEEYHCEVDGAKIYITE